MSQVGATKFRNVERLLAECDKFDRDVVLTEIDSEVLERHTSYFNKVGTSEQLE